MINIKSEILHTLLFGPYLLIIWKIETHYQQQNFSECCYQKIKRLTNTIIDNSGDPAYM